MPNNHSNLVKRVSWASPSKNRRRRNFLKQSVKYAMLSGSAVAINTRLGMVGSAMAASSDYENLGDRKSLVCVYLSGGCDMHQLLVPGDPETLARLSLVRGDLALKSQEVNFQGEGSTRIGFNSALKGLAKLYSEGDLAVVQNVGNLHAPVSRSDFLADRKWLPPDLFSHRHQYNIWSTATSSRSPTYFDTGWAGRMADLLIDTTNEKQMSLATSLAGRAPWLTGAEVVPLSTNTQELITLRASSEDAAANTITNDRERTRSAILKLSPDHTLKQQVSDTLTRSTLEQSVLSELLEQESRFLPDDESDRGSLYASLQQVARLIVQHDAMQMPRQIFFVEHTGWDTHTDQRKRLTALMMELDSALSGFQRTLRQQGLGDAVTTFTASEFGRTLTPTSSGSGHGWGADTLVMGGAVKGGSLHGSAPNYEIGGSDDAGNLGRFIPGTSVSQLGASLATWFGLSTGDIADIFPDLRFLQSLPQLDLFNI